MAVTTLETPNKTIYDPFPPVAYQSGFNSAWVCAHLPILYKFLSDRYPTNNLDSPVSISSHADNGAGLVEFTTSGAHGWNKFDYVTISSSSITAYNGTFEIIEVGSTTTFTINVAYDASSLGSPTALQYYNNYHLKIEFYQGLDSSHPDYLNDPESLKATIRVLVNSDNEGFVDLARLCQAYVNANNSFYIPSWPNYLNGWTQVRIKVYEAYDESDGTTISVTENDQGYESYIYPVNSKKLFRSTYGHNMGDFAMNGTTGNAKFLTPRNNALLFPDFYFDLAILIEDADTYTLIIREKNASGVVVNLIASDQVIADNGLFRFKINDLITSVAECIEVLFSKGEAGGIDDYTWFENTDISLASFIGWDCFVNTQGYFFFCGRDDNTGFAKLYRSTDEGLTWSLVLTGGGYTFTGIGVEGTDVAITTSGGTDVYYSSDDGANFALMANGSSGYDCAIKGGVVFACTSTGISGIKKTTDFGATAWTTIGIGSGSYILKKMFWRTNQLGWVVGATGRIYKTTNGGTGWTNQTTGTDNLEGIYMIDDNTGVICGQGGVIYRTTNGGTLWSSITSPTVENLWDIEFLTSEVAYIVGDNGTILRSEDAGLTWTADTTALGTGDYSAISNYNNSAEVLMLTTSYSVESQKLIAVVEQIPASETKEICINRGCNNQDIYLTWLNNLGGWDYHLFTAEKDFITAIEESVQGERSIYDGFPDRFINGETLTEWLSVRARDGIIVRSQFLTQAQADEVARIQHSIHVQWMINGKMTDKKTVLVDKGSFTRYSESNKLETVEFRILMTDETPIQSN